MNKKWIEHNKKEYGVQIIELKKIIESQVKDGGKANEFTSDMLVALVSGRKITTKMQNAINGIIRKESPEQKFKRDSWLQSVLPKLMMVREQINNTNWSGQYKINSLNFINSIIAQAKNRKTLTKNQMEAVSKMYVRIKKNIEKKS
tara:strand:+ start:664 stop:1101 length:438 start_codon:yes stop_codon:yes gene_type:complete